MMVGKRACQFFGLALASALTASAAAAQTPEQFYTGRTVNFVVGVSPGGGYDQYARLLARHFGRHLPGQPTIVVRNMPGAGSLTAVLHLNGSAPADGATIVAFNAGLLNDSMSEGAAARARFTDFAWLGSITRDFRVCFAWRGTGILAWDDLVKRRESVFGAAGPASSSANNIAMLRNLFNINLRTIHGYPGNTEMFLAIERGEVDGSCVTWSSLPDHWVRNNSIAVLNRLSPSTQPGVPASAKYIGDLATTQQQKDILEVLLASGELGRPFIASQKVSDDRLKALRAAFDASMTDPALLADAEKQRLPVDPVSGAEAEKIVARLYGFPPELLAKAKEAVR
ncbi:MAG: Bug family tripartite tricarboxylate transporter substrate binding protein [Beijerinckiaceae bacterium]